ncbi:hypothetical protein BG004_006262 [Podila humilis]|nr:hypothetical protein BG004_006262 [Podila humilis]
MPTLPVFPVTRKSISGVSSGGYKPNHRPPPIPITAPAPHLNGNGGITNNYSETPLPPGRPSTSSPRPSLPFLEKYAKKNKSTPPTPTLPSSHDFGQNNTGLTLSSAPLVMSPVTSTTPAPHDMRLPGHYVGHQHQREQHEYFPKTPTNDSFSSSLRQPTLQQRQQQQQSYESLGHGTPAASTIPLQSRTPIVDNTYTPRDLRYPQPTLPQKSNARSPSIASAHGLGVLVDVQGKVKSASRPQFGGNEHDTASSSMDYTSPASPPPPSVSSKFSRSGSNGSLASSVAGDSRQPTLSSGRGRERSNTLQSEISERSVRTVRSERTQGVDIEGRQRSGSGGGGGSGRRPSALPSRKPSTDKFDALMEDLMQEINTLPNVTTIPSARESLRRSVRDASSRSRSRPGIPEFNMQQQQSLSSPPPTPGLPNVTSGTESMPSRYRASTRESRTAVASDRLQSYDRTSRRTTNTTTTHAAPVPTEAAVPDRELERGLERRRERDRDRTRDREQERDGDRHRDRERTRERNFEHGRERTSELEKEKGRGRDRDRERRTHRPERESSVGHERAARERDKTSARPSARSRSANGRVGVKHCEGCKHDIQSHERLDTIKMTVGEYHRDCFKCGRCRRTIESASQAREHDGRLLCERDYTRVKEREAQKAASVSLSASASALSSSPRPVKAASSLTSSRRPVCAGCETIIRSPDVAVYALGKPWHEQHLSCDHCHQPIQTSVGHVEKNGRVYCPRDFRKLFKPKCRGCGLVVETEAVCAQDGKLEGKWHAECFGCQTCKRPFPDKRFYVFGDAPYCQRHYHKVNNSLCKGCDKAIEGPCAQTMEGWRYHPDCFSCHECRTPLTDVYFSYDNKAYCEYDIMVIQRTGNVRAERRKTVVGRV